MSPSHYITNTQLSGISNTSYSFSFQPLYHIVLCYGNRVITIRCKETEFFVFLSSLFSLAAFNNTLFPLVFVEGTSSHTSVSHTHTLCTLSHSMYSSHNTLFPLVFVEGNRSHSVAPLGAPYTFEKKRVCYSINDTYNSHSFQWFREVVPSTPPLPWSNCSSSVVRSPHSTRRSPRASQSLLDCRTTVHITLSSTSAQ